MTIRVGIFGAGGRMGAALLRALDERDDLELAASIGRSSDPGEALQGVHVAIDFSRAEATQRNADACAAAGVPLLIGTTGLSEETHAHLDALAKRIPILVSANTSLGLNVLVELTRRAAASLPAGFDIEIFESHHRHKIDAPSGTALALGDAAAAGRGTRITRPAHVTGTEAGPRGEGAIGFSVMRGGDVVGEHEVRFLGSGEQVRLAHVATDRAIFARGALSGARWLASRSPEGTQWLIFFLRNSELGNSMPSLHAPGKGISGASLHGQK